MMREPIGQPETESLYLVRKKPFSSGRTMPEKPQQTTILRAG
jgi:hypothetical protein